MSTPVCNSCGNELVYCPHCSGSDDIEGGKAQGPDGYWLCQDEDCEGYSFCCGC